jgi:hypothetical protein
MFWCSYASETAAAHHFIGNEFSFLHRAFSGSRLLQTFFLNLYKNWSFTFLVSVPIAEISSLTKILPEILAVVSAKTTLGRSLLGIEHCAISLSLS